MSTLLIGIWVKSVGYWNEKVAKIETHAIHRLQNVRNILKSILIRSYSYRQKHLHNHNYLYCQIEQISSRFLHFSQNQCAHYIGKVSMKSTHLKHFLHLINPSIQFFLNCLWDRLTISLIEIDLRKWTRSRFCNDSLSRRKYFDRILNTFILVSSEAQSKLFIWRNREDRIPR